MNQQLALEIMVNGEHVLLTGPAGSGKTHVLQQFITLEKQLGKKVSVTASTGLAATHLGGTTVHSWAGIGIHDELPRFFADNIAKGRREIIETTDVLIIDEVSMLHDFRLDMIDEACRLIRKEPDKPFGGIQVVMSGDFFQLPPINRGNSRSGGFVVHSKVWAEIDPVICYLDEQHRQDDPVLSTILQAMRSGDIRRNHAEELLSRSEDIPDEDDITELHTVNVDVDSINAERLRRLEGDEIEYQRHTTGSENYVTTLQRSVLAPDILRIKHGALVMAVKNSPDRKYVNGSIGRVVAFEPSTDYPIVKFRNGHEIVVQPDTWELRDGDHKRASISQIPLRLAWAITIHKSQGMTLDAAIIDLRKAFVEGMGYVALSRIRSLDTLYLRGINRKALQVSEEAQQIDEWLRESSLKAAKEYHYLEEKPVSATLKLSSKKHRKNDWNTKLAQMRETHPNAYRPWKKEDDDLLRQDFQNGASVASLSRALGRHERSVIMRLQKHFGEDVSL